MKYVFVDGNIQFDTESDDFLAFYIDNWDDYGYKTLFGLSLFHNQEYEDLGRVHIGVISDGTRDKQTYDWLQINGYMNRTLEKLPDKLIFMGNLEFYQKMWRLFSESNAVKYIYHCLNDIVTDENLLRNVQGLPVVQTSFFRDNSITLIRQFKRVAFGGALHVNFNWNLIYKNVHGKCMNISFANDLSSEIPTNLFALIGRNGSGKTSLLKDIVNAANHFGEWTADSSFLSGYKAMLKNGADTIYSDSDSVDKLTRLVYVSYSSFDIYNESFVEAFKNNTTFKFVGNRRINDNKITEDGLNTLVDPEDAALRLEIDLEWLFYDTNGVSLFNNAMEAFNWDDELSDITQRINEATYTSDSEGIRSAVQQDVLKLSSGQKIIISMLTNLVRSSIENSLFLIDEPELYLHPPYSLALVLAIDKILKETNSLCIISTHSAVTVQEIPRCNVNIIDSNGVEKELYHPENETFGADISTINNEIFGLDIRSTGFYTVLRELVMDSTNVNNEKIDELLHGNILGKEARAYLSIMRRNNV
jgi:predicted ATPase